MVIFAVHMGRRCRRSDKRWTSAAGDYRPGNEGKHGIDCKQASKQAVGHIDPRHTGTGLPASRHEWMAWMHSCKVVCATIVIGGAQQTLYFCFYKQWLVTDVAVCHSVLSGRPTVDSRPCGDDVSGGSAARFRFLAKTTQKLGYTPGPEDDIQEQMDGRKKCLCALAGER